MKVRELRIGNIIEYSISVSEPMVKNVIVEKIVDAEVISNLYHLGDVDIYKPIPLTEEWLVRMGDNKNKAPFPDWIKYVHEAQNWYYWNNNKQELTIKNK